MVVAAVSVNVGIHLCLFWGVCHCLGGHLHCLGGGGLSLALSANCIVSSSFVVVVVWCLLLSVIVALSCGLLVGQALSAHQLTMINDGFKSVHHLVATLLSVTWHLGCVSVKRKEGDDLL